MGGLDVRADSYACDRQVGDSCTIVLILILLRCAVWTTDTVADSGETEVLVSNGVSLTIVSILILLKWYAPLV